MNQKQEKITLTSLLSQISNRPQAAECYGLSGLSAAYLIARINQEKRWPVLVMMPSPKEAESLLADLQYFLKRAACEVLYFPPYNILPLGYLSYHNETAARRIGTLYRMMTAKLPPVVVTTAAAMSQKIIPRKELVNYADLIMVGEELERDLLIDQLIAGGYISSAIVEEPGDFCVRGGILDIFSSMYPDPLRIELFGDTVESIRFFSAANQRTIKNLREAVILPAKEAILKKEWRVEIISRIRKQVSKLGLPAGRVRQLVDRI
ncbi:MAG: transcription-repair coupling factor, partial [Desulfobacterales bacterium]